MSGVEASDTTLARHRSDSKEYHAAFSFFIAALLGLVGVRYQGSSTSLFTENRGAFSLFIISLSLYTAALLKVAASETQRRYCTYVFIAAGISASELLLFILLAYDRPFDLLVINLLVAAFLIVLSRASHGAVAGPAKKDSVSAHDSGQSVDIGNSAGSSPSIPDVV